MPIRTAAVTAAWVLALGGLGVPVAALAGAAEGGGASVGQLTGAAGVQATTVTEDFELGNSTGPTDVRDCPAPIAHGVLFNGCFNPDAVQPGIELSTTPSHPGQPVFALLGDTFFGDRVRTQTLAAQNDHDALVMHFPTSSATHPVDFVSFDLWHYGAVASICRITVRLVDTTQPPILTTALCNPTGTSPTASKIVISPNAPISSITIKDLSSIAPVEIVDNITFGSQSTVPTPSTPATPGSAPTGPTPTGATTQPDGPQAEGPKGPDGPAQDLAPNTRVLRKPISSSARTVRVKVRSTVPGSTFQCRMDAQKKFRRCRPSQKLTVRIGEHLLQIRAIGPSGLPDPTPAKIRWVTTRPR
jgi:hypothetical protein